MKKLNKKSIKANRQLRPIKASYDAYTEDLSDFGMREIEELRDILTAWIDNGLPDDFWDSGVKPAFNRNSGYVFLTNDEYQVCMEVDGKLESFYNTPYSGYEGFYEDLLYDADESWEYEDLEYLRDIAESRGDTEGIDKLTALMADDGGDLDIESSTRRCGRTVYASAKPLSAWEKKECIEWIAYNYGISKKAATERYKEYSDERRRSILDGSKANAKKSFYND